MIMWQKLNNAIVIVMNSTQCIVKSLNLQEWYLQQHHQMIV